MFHLHHEIEISSMISNQQDSAVDRSTSLKAFTHAIFDILSSYDTSSSRDNDRYDDDYRKYILTVTNTQD